MAYISYNKLWESDFDNVLMKREKLQDLNIKKLKLKVNDVYEKDEKLTTNFKPIEDSDVINKAFLDGKLSRIEGHISLVEKHYYEFKLNSDKQSNEEVLIQKAVKTTTQFLYDNGLFINYNNADQVKKKIFCLKQKDLF